jgi:hypothetical protein
MGESFAHGARVLHQLAGVPLGESTVQRLTKNAGTRVAEPLDAGTTFGPATTPFTGPLDQLGQRLADFSIDATGPRQQAGDGGAAEGRMAYVAARFAPPVVPRAFQRSPPRPARYLSGLYALHELGPLVCRPAAQVGMESADVWIARTDGGAGLEAFARTNFNRADLVVLVDFYHAASYWEQLAQALHP